MKPPKDGKSRATCHDCGALEGELHAYGCDMERCPWCGDQLITCGCRYLQMGYTYEEPEPRYDSNGKFLRFSGHLTCGLPEKVYKEGLPKEEEEKFLDILQKKGRIPWIRWPLICAYCGGMWPGIFMVSDKEWEKYIQPDMRRALVCKPCYDHIKRLVDLAAGGEHAA